MEYSEILGVKRCGNLLLKFSFPAIISMMVNGASHIVDRIFVSRIVGMKGMSAITVAAPLFSITLAFGLLIGIGTAVNVSIKLGENNKSEAEDILANSLLLTLIVSFLLTVIGIKFSEPLLKLIGASSSVLPVAKTFVTVFLLGTVFNISSIIMYAVLRAVGNPKMAMIIMAGGAIINTILNPLFILVFHFGIAGSALATVVAHYLTAAFGFCYFIGNKSVLKLRLRSFIPHVNLLKSIILIGTAPFLFHVTSSLTHIIFNKTLALYGGDSAIAAMGIIHTVSMLIIMPVAGISQGAQAIISYNYGARKFDRVKRTAIIAMAVGTYITTISFIMLKLFQNQILQIFISGNKQVLAISSMGISISLLMLPFAGIHSINYFEAVGNVRISILISLSRHVLFQLPLLLVLPHLFKLNGVWATGPVSELLSILLTVTLLIREFRRIDRKEKLVKPIYA